MPDAAAFLRMIAAAPDDDAPRLVYADWLEEHGDPRGAFIRVQCALAALPDDDPRRPDLEQAERRLLAGHAAAWTHEFAARVGGWQFRRGFVEEITLSAEDFLEHAPDLLRAGTVRTVHLHDCRDALHKLTRLPTLGRVAGLDLCGNRLGDDGAGRLLRSGHLRHAQALDLSFNGLSDAAVQALLDAGPWPRLRSLGLCGNEGITGRAAAAIAQSGALPALEQLDLGDNRLDATAVWRLSNSRTLPRLSALHLAGNPFGDAGVRALARGPLLPRMLRHAPALDLGRTDTGPAGVQALLAGGRLRPVRILRLDGNRLGDAGLTALALADLPNLRELYVGDNGITDDGALALAGAPLLNRLTRLDLSCNRLSPAGKVELMSSPYRHWRTVFDTEGNRPSDSGPDGDAPIPFDDDE